MQGHRWHLPRGVSAQPGGPTYCQGLRSVPPAAAWGAPGQEKGFKVVKEPQTCQPPFPERIADCWELIFRGSVRPTNHPKVVPFSSVPELFGCPKLGWECPGLPAGALGGW